MPSHLAVRVRHVNRNDFCFCHFTPVNTIGVNTQLNLPKTCVFLGYNVNVFIFVHIDADDDFQVPDWHWP
ncbi:TPA: hypothetical protein HGT49_25920, partial [Escherichia coli]|nr:hypothetical protein [Escherichia coli]